MNTRTARVALIAFLTLGLVGVAPGLAHAETVETAPAPAPSQGLAELAPETPALLFPPFEKLTGNDPFAEGKWTMQIYGSGTYSQKNDRAYGGHLGVGYHILDGVSINAELAGEYLHSDDSQNPHATGGDTGGGALDVVVRWHFLRGDGWSIYAEGGGVMESAESFPAAGTHFNFRPQFGMGATLRLTPDVYLMGGAKLFHISNAGIGGPEHNPGFDSFMYYLGVMIPF